MLSSQSTFSAALEAFLQLQETKTKCEIALLGCSSPGGNTVGHDVLEGDLSISEAYKEHPELKAFAEFNDVLEFSLSALIEIVEDDGAEVAVRGSSLLADKARLTINAFVRAESGGPISARCPVVSIRGEEAVALGRATVQSTVTMLLPCSKTLTNDRGSPSLYIFFEHFRPKEKDVSNPQRGK